MLNKDKEGIFEDVVKGLFEKKGGYMRWIIAVAICLMFVGNAYADYIVRDSGGNTIGTIVESPTLTPAWRD